MKLAVDRLEGDFAVCVAASDEGRERVFSLPVWLFPEQPREGDIYLLSLEPDADCRDRQARQAKEKLRKLFEKDKSEKGERQMKTKRCAFTALTTSS